MMGGDSRCCNCRITLKNHLHATAAAAQEHAQWGVRVRLTRTPRCTLVVRCLKSNACSRLAQPPPLVLQWAPYIMLAQRNFSTL